MLERITLWGCYHLFRQENLREFYNLMQERDRLREQRDALASAYCAVLHNIVNRPTLPDGNFAPLTPENEAMLGHAISGAASALDAVGGAQVVLGYLERIVRLRTPRGG